jgi:hypothetical protein
MSKFSKNLNYVILTLHWCFLKKKIYIYASQLGIYTSFVAFWVKINNLRNTCSEGSITAVPPQAAWRGG